LMCVLKSFATHVIFLLSILVLPASHLNHQLSALPPFPTRRSSDLRLLDDAAQGQSDPVRERRGEPGDLLLSAGHARQRAGDLQVDRKSTRLNSTHVSLSYAVFCLKNKIIYNLINQMFNFTSSQQSL